MSKLGLESLRPSPSPDVKQAPTRLCRGLFVCPNSAWRRLTHEPACDRAYMFYSKCESRETACPEEGGNMALHATGRFQIKSWDERPYDENGPKLTRASVTNAYQGEIEG